MTFSLFQNSNQLNEVESTTGTLGTKNFVAEDTGANDDDYTSPQLHLQTISEGDSLNGEDQNVLPLTKENVDKLDSVSDKGNKAKTNGHDSEAAKRQLQTPMSDPMRQARYNSVRTPGTDYSTNQRQKKMSSGSLPPLVPAKNNLTNGKSPAVKRPKSLSPKNGPVLRMNRSYEYRINKKAGFQHYRKLGIIPDWK